MIPQLYHVKIGDFLNIEGSSYLVINVVEYNIDVVFWKEFELQTNSNTRLWLTIERNPKNPKYRILSSKDTSPKKKTGFFSDKGYSKSMYKSAYQSFSTKTTITYVAGSSHFKVGDTIDHNEFISENGQIVDCKTIGRTEFYAYGREIKPEDVRLEKSLFTPSDPQLPADSLTSPISTRKNFNFAQMSMLVEGQRINVCGTVYVIKERVLFEQGMKKHLWAEYELNTGTRVRKWLSVDEGDEGRCLFALHTWISFVAVNIMNETIATLSTDESYKVPQEALRKTYKLCDKGDAIVASFSKSGDYDTSERMAFSEYRSDNGDILTHERWGLFEEEASIGKEISENDIELLDIIPSSEEPKDFISQCLTFLGLIVILIFLGLESGVALSVFGDLVPTNIAQEIASKPNYHYETSVTLENQSKAKVYSTSLSPAEACEDLIKLAPKQILFITTPKNAVQDKEHLIQSRNSTVMLYKSTSGSTHVQVSDYQYNGNTYNVYKAQEPLCVGTLYSKSKAWYNDPRRDMLSSRDIEIDAKSYDQPLAAARSIGARRSYGGARSFGK